jgi:hypothetical protein
MYGLQWQSYFINILSHLGAQIHNVYVVFTHPVLGEKMTFQANYLLGRIFQILSKNYKAFMSSKSARV